MSFPADQVLRENNAGRLAGWRTFVPTVEVGSPCVLQAHLDASLFHAGDGDRHIINDRAAAGVQ